MNGSVRFDSCEYPIAGGLKQDFSPVVNENGGFRAKLESRRRGDQEQP